MQYLRKSTFLTRNVNTWNRYNRNVNFETMRFGLYILFPVCTLFLFNSPEVLDLFPDESFDKVRNDFEFSKQNAFKVPTTWSEINDRLARIKSYYSKDN
ncbi:hypothetical protein BC833DRAFT_605308, partial [Globomyces pollinis-pini]